MFYSLITHLFIFYSYSIFIGFCFWMRHARYLDDQLSIFGGVLWGSWSRCWGGESLGFWAGEGGCSCGFGIGWELKEIGYLICSFYHYTLKITWFISNESQYIHQSHLNLHRQLLHTFSWILLCRNLEYMLGTLTTSDHNLKIV